MLYLNVNDQVLAQWGRTIDLYHSLHLGNLSNEINSVNFLVEEEPVPNSDKVLFKVGISVFPRSGEVIRILIEREHCGDAIEQAFAKAKRYLVRRIRGISCAVREPPNTLGNLGDRL